MCTTRVPKVLLFPCASLEKDCMLNVCAYKHCLVDPSVLNSWLSQFDSPQFSSSIFHAYRLEIRLRVLFQRDIALFQVLELKASLRCHWLFLFHIPLLVQGCHHLQEHKIVSVISSSSLYYILVNHVYRELQTRQCMRFTPSETYNDPIDTLHIPTFL